MLLWPRDYKYDQDIYCHLVAIYLKMTQTILFMKNLNNMPKSLQNNFYIYYPLNIPDNPVKQVILLSPQNPEA